MMKTQRPKSLIDSKHLHLTLKVIYLCRMVPSNGDPGSNVLDDLKAFIIYEIVLTVGNHTEAAWEITDHIGA